MKAADSSFAIAAFASWHEHHEAARDLLDSGVVLVEHCALETYSVLTRLPPPHRSPGTLVRDFITTRFDKPLLRLGARDYRNFLFGLPEAGISGGSSYDALVAATAAASKAELLTCDRRAASIYEIYGVRARFLG